jgi:hypothetical protein
MSDRRAVLVGICNVGTIPDLAHHTRYSNSVRSPRSTATR